MSGHLYAVVHPMYPGYVKIGKATSPIKRLGSYNTGDPFRRYSLAWTLQCDDYALAERIAHARLRGHRVGRTEWFQVHPEDAFGILKEYLKDV